MFYTNLCAAYVLVIEFTTLRDEILKNVFFLGLESKMEKEYEFEFLNVYRKCVHIARQSS